jgi:hypothetical protein
MNSLQESIIVYDNYEIPLHKYPRINTDKEKTDIIIIVFLMHEEFLKKLAKSYEEAIQYHHDCKEYYYTFIFNKEIRKYSAQDIMTITNHYDKVSYMEQIYYFYVRNKNFYLELYESMEHAKKSYFERREYLYRIIPPNDFYNRIPQMTYSAIELMEINSFAQYLKKNKIIKELPLPKYINL